MTHSLARDAEKRLSDSAWTLVIQDLLNTTTEHGRVDADLKWLTEEILHMVLAAQQEGYEIAVRRYERLLRVMYSERIG